MSNGAGTRPCGRTKASYERFRLNASWVTFQLLIKYKSSANIRLRKKGTTTKSRTRMPPMLYGVIAHTGSVGPPRQSG
jgi:hypothetical protein